LPKGRKLPLTFTAAAANYLAGEREVGGKDLAAKERHLRLHLGPYFGRMRVDGAGEDAITEFTVEKFRGELRRQGMSESGVNHVLATYRHMGRKLASRLVLEKPLPMVKLKKVEDRRDFIFSFDQERAMLDAALRDSSAYIWLFIKIGLSTSLRHSEIPSARFDGIDTQRRRLRIKAKGGYWRDQPLSQDIAAVLAQERGMAEDRDSWVFSNLNSRSGHIDSMKKAFRRCVVRAGLDPQRATPHTMRHTAITNLA
jgi:integrase